MIIGLEWLVIVFFASFILLWVASLIVHNWSSKVSAVLVALALLVEITFGVFIIGTMTAHKNIEDHYVEYLKLQTQVAHYEDLDVLEQSKVSTGVMTYNLWYERNKSDLENEWTFKGSSDYAKEFKPIVIGG